MTQCVDYAPLVQVDPFLLVVQEHPDLHLHPFLPFFQLVLVFHRFPATRRFVFLLCSNPHLNIRHRFTKNPIRCFQINAKLIPRKDLVKTFEMVMIFNMSSCASLVERNYSPVFLVVLGVPFLPQRLLYPEVTKPLLL